MVSAMPELIFVSGPQQGERAVIMTGTAVLGRSPSADVKLLEEAASREHVRFQLTRDGWVMENLSANGTLINGRRYKKDKKILLDTGDVMGIGLETRILYVSPGDDPEEALEDWRQANPPAQPRPAETKARAGKPSQSRPPPPPHRPPGRPPASSPRRRCRRGRQDPPKRPLLGPARARRKTASGARPRRVARSSSSSCWWSCCWAWSASGPP
jgi:pSer/pThr/pTyr-binding forkhead associated (FHA) protein